MKLILILLFLFSSSVFAKEDIILIVPFGKGGSTDRMSRIMKPFLEEELKENINIINKKGQGTLEGTNAFFKLKGENNILASSFSPYVSNTILGEKANYKIEDFEILNIQWFDFEFIAVHKNSSYTSMIELINAIKISKRPLKVASLYNSTGSIIIKLLMKKLKIEKNKISFVFYHGGQKAREALISQKVDILAISAQGSEKYREFIKPLAIIKEKRSKRWDAPTLNDALEGMNISLPVFKGSMRGFAVSKKFKEKNLFLYQKLLSSFKRVLAKKKVQLNLKKHNIGSTWIGPLRSKELLKESYTLFKKYNYLN